MTAAAARALTIFAALLLVMTAGQGCSPPARYRVLSFIFDGVPVPEGTGAAAALSTSGTKPPAAPKTVVSRHAPYVKKQCAACHTPMTNTLVAAVPELCFSCHKMGQLEKRYVHAPALAGFCRLCHDPHASRHPFLLLAPPRQMCFYCHNPEDVAKNRVHEDEQAPCTQCHNPHADNRYFLADALAGTAAPSPLPPGAEGVKTARAEPAGPLPVTSSPPAAAVLPPSGGVTASEAPPPGEEPQSSDASLPQSLATLLELWQLDDLAAEARGWTVFNFQARLLPKYFDGVDSFALPGLAFVAVPATEQALRAWNLPCLVREEDGKGGGRFVVLSALVGDRAIVLGPGGERIDIPISLWMKQLSGDLAFLAPVEAVPAALYPGEQGPAVLALQEQLQRTGFLDGQPSAAYDAATADAVRALQGSVGLAQDGIAGRQVRLRLLVLDGRTIPLLGEQR